MQPLYKQPPSGPQKYPRAYSGRPAGHLLPSSRFSFIFGHVDVDVCAGQPAGWLGAAWSTSTLKSTSTSTSASASTSASTSTSKPVARKRRPVDCSCRSGARLIDTREVAQVNKRRPEGAEINTRSRMRPRGEQTKPVLQFRAPELEPVKFFFLASISRRCWEFFFFHFVSFRLFGSNRRNGIKNGGPGRRLMGAAS